MGNLGGSLGAEKEKEKKASKQQLKVPLRHFEASNTCNQKVINDLLQTGIGKRPESGLGLTRDSRSRSAALPCGHSLRPGGAERHRRHTGAGRCRPKRSTLLAHPSPAPGTERSCSLAPPGPPFRAGRGPDRALWSGADPVPGTPGTSTQVQARQGGAGPREGDWAVPAALPVPVPSFTSSSSSPTWAQLGCPHRVR